jgi:hypothetical protein
MKLKLPYDNRNDAFAFESQTIDGEELDFKSIMANLKGSKARLIIQLSGLWFAGGRYGCTWKVVRGMFEVVAKKTLPQFIVDSDDDLANEEADEEEDQDLVEDATAAVAAVSVEATAEEEAVADEEQEDDEEEEDEDSEVDEPPPPPPPVQKKPTKAKTAKK